MSDPNSPRAEWSDQEREFNLNGDDNNEGEELADPFAEFGGFDLAPDENENPGRLPVLYKARPPTPSEASDVDMKTKALFEELYFSSLLCMANPLWLKDISFCCFFLIQK